MSELTPAAYQSLRDFAVSATAVPTQWDYIELYDDTGSAVTRISVTGDARASWVDLDGDKAVKVQVDIEGSDGDIPLPTTFASSAIWDDASGATGASQITTKESITNATFDQSGDSMTVTHTLNIPQ